MPAGSVVTNGDTSDAQDINTPLADFEADANIPRPIVAGGTGASSAAAALVNLGLTATAAEINVLDGITATVTELNYTDGVTSAIQTQLNAKQAAGATLTSLEGLSLAAGDVLYATAADTLARLPLGTAGQALAVNAGATAPAWRNTVTPITASGGTLTDLTTSFANRLSVSFVATGVTAVLTAGVGASHGSATATDVLGELRIYDTVALSDVATSAGGETATNNLSYAVRFSLPVSINTLVPGRTYEAQLWLRKTVSAGPTLPQNLRIDGFTA